MQRRIPVDLHRILGSAPLRFCLGTREPCEARRRLVYILAWLETEFEAARTEHDAPSERFQ